MKRILTIASVLPALLLCLTVASAETIPSIAIGDMKRIEVAIETTGQSICSEAVFAPETVTAIQEGIALLTVLSR